MNVKEFIASSALKRDLAFLDLDSAPIWNAST